MKTNDMKTKAVLMGVIAIVFMTLSCNAQNSNSRQRDQGPPSVDEIFEKMDEDEDDFLSEKEVKGPLKDMFEEIDEDENGLLSKEEVENAPKPSKGRRERL